MSGNKPACLNAPGSKVNRRGGKCTESDFSVHFQHFEHLGFMSTDADGRNCTSPSAEHYIETKRKQNEAFKAVLLK